MALRITLAVPTDAPALIACIDASFAEYVAQGIDIPSVADGLHDDIILGRVWAARDDESGDGTIIGAMVLTDDRTFAHLRVVAVHPDHRGRGLGRVLIDKAVALASQTRCLSIGLITHPAMQGNVALYQHLGWRITRQTDTQVKLERPLATG